MLERRRPRSQVGWGWNANYEQAKGRTELELESLPTAQGLRQRNRPYLSVQTDLPLYSHLSPVFRRSLSDKSHRSDDSFSSSTSCSSDEESLELHLPPGERRYDSRRRVPWTIVICLLVCMFMFLSQLQCYSPYDRESLSLSGSHLVDLSSTRGASMLGAPNHDVDALVFVSLGPKAISPAFTWSVRSAIESGGWRGLVYIITDDPTSTRTIFEATDDHTGRFPSEKIKIIEPQDNLIGFRPEDEDTSVTYKARVTKCQLLKILPKDLEHVLYIDADIMVGGSMTPFFEELELLWRQKKENMPMALFEDCRAFTAGFSAECDTWNTGVMSLRRGSSESCMELWCEKLSELEGSDQAALDAVIAEGACQGIEALDRSHLRMMKDVFVLVGFIGNKTFNHFTQLFRPHKLQTLHRWFYERMLGRNLGLLIPDKLLSENPTQGSQTRGNPISVPHEEDYL